MKKIVLIPAYKPDKELIDIVGQLKENNFEIVIVNDGSGTEYEQIFAEVSKYAVIYTHLINKGKGEALKTGIDNIIKKYSAPYIIVTADADGQHKINDILKVCKTAEKNPNALVLGCRKFNGNVPFCSRFGNNCTRFVFRLVSSINVSDTQTGLRAFGDKLARKMLSIGGSRYEYEMNVLMETAKSHIPIKEEEIETVYINGNSSSNFNVVKDSFRIYKEIIKFSLSSFVAFLLDYGLFCLLFSVTGIMELANITARIFSSTVNFYMNKRLVFRSEVKMLSSAIRYFSLAVFILICNTMILKILINLGINAFAAKIMTEVMLFLFSYIIQHTFVFEKEH